MGFEVKAKCISKGYYEQRVVWECVDEHGNGFGHDYSLKGCKFWIDEELKGNISL